MTVKVVVQIDDALVFSLATGDGCEATENQGCGKDELPRVLDALENAIEFCRIESSRFDDADRVSNGGSSASEINRDVPVSVMRDHE